jgi:hypothetical protein
MERIEYSDNVALIFGLVIILIVIYFILSLITTVMCGSLSFQFSRLALDGPMCWNVGGDPINFFEAWRMTYAR